MDDILAIVYGIIFFVGFASNGSLIITLCCGPGARARSPLVIGLVVADLFVCCISGPLTAFHHLVSEENQYIKCGAFILQTWPEAASTLSMMAISVHRYLTVKNFRPAGYVVRKRSLLIAVSISTWIIAVSFSCLELIDMDPWRIAMNIIRQICVYVIPICIVFCNHICVHAKLTALSLTARAKHGELPLPMPLLRRPTHVIIVAGIPSSIENTPITPINNNAPIQDNDATEDQVPRSTLESRRHLAHSLLWMTFVFACCWLPSAVCNILIDLGTPVSKGTLSFSLLLGHCHSVISPLLYWGINYQYLQFPCRFRLPTRIINPPSSTNEAALGPFNPRFTRPPRVVSRRQSSYYLY